jgi:hypothetical protein
MFLVVLISFGAHADVSAETFGISRPEPEAGPTPVDFGIVIADIGSIDSAEQSFTADVGLIMRWRDPRLIKPGGSVRIMSRTDVWNPDIFLFNQRSITMQLPDQVEVSPDGVVYFRQRYTGEFSNRIYVADFPFDAHDFRVQFVSLRYGPDEVKFSNEALRDRTGMIDSPLVVDWQITSWNIQNNPFNSKLMALPRSSFGIAFHGQRRAGFFLMKLLLPLALVVCMSWVVFWLDPERIDAQVGMAATAILTLIAYRFTFDSLLPPVSYLTRVDYFISGSTALVFLSLLQVVITGTLVSRNRILDARKMDRWSRVVFPTLFALLTFWSFFARSS